MVLLISTVVSRSWSVILLTSSLIRFIDYGINVTYIYYTIPVTSTKNQEYLVRSIEEITFIISGSDLKQFHVIVEFILTMNLLYIISSVIESHVHRIHAS